MGIIVSYFKTHYIAICLFHRSSEQEKEDFKKRRTQELFDVVQKARQSAKMRAQEVSKEVEVSDQLFKLQYTYICAMII